MYFNCVVFVLSLKYDLSQLLSYLCAVLLVLCLTCALSYLCSALPVLCLLVLCFTCALSYLCSVLHVLRLTCNVTYLCILPVLCLTYDVSHVVSWLYCHISISLLFALQFQYNCWKGIVIHGVVIYIKTIYNVDLPLMLPFNSFMGIIKCCLSLWHFQM